MGLFKPKAEKVYERVASEYPEVFNRIHAILVIDDPQKIVEINVKLNEDLWRVVDDNGKNKRFLMLKIGFEMGFSEGARSVYMARLSQVNEKVQIALGQLSDKIVDKYPDVKDRNKVEVECINLYCEYIKSTDFFNSLPRNTLTMSMTSEMWKECFQIYSSKGKIDLPTWKKLRQEYT